MLNIGIFSLFIVFGGSAVLFLSQPTDTTNTSNSNTSGHITSSSSKTNNIKVDPLQFPLYQNNPNYQSLPENLRWKAKLLTAHKAIPLENETDQNIKLCRFNSGNDNGITASCLNAFVHSNIDSESNNLFFKKLIEKLRLEQKSITNHSASINPHSVIQNVFDELGNDVIFQNVNVNERDNIKNCLLTGGNNPFEFVTALYKICGMEQNEKFARSVTNKWLNTKTWSSPCMQLKPEQNSGFFSGIKQNIPALFLENYIDWDGFSKADFKKYLDYTFTWNENISVNYPTEFITVSMDKLLPFTNCQLIGHLDDHIWDFVIPGHSEYRLKAVICCNMTRNEILDGKVHYILKANRKFSCILNNSELNRFVVIDPSTPNSIKKQQRIDHNVDPYAHENDSLENLIKINDDTYRIPVMLFYKKLADS